MKEGLSLSIFLKLSVFYIIFCYSNLLYADVISYDMSVSMGNPTGFNLQTSNIENGASVATYIRQLGSSPNSEYNSVPNHTNPVISGITASTTDIGRHAYGSASADANGIYVSGTGGVSVPYAQATSYELVRRSWRFSADSTGTLSVSVPYSINWTTVGIPGMASVNYDLGTAGFSFIEYDLFLIFAYNNINPSYGFKRLYGVHYLTTATGSLSGNLTVSDVSVNQGDSIQVSEEFYANASSHLDDYTPPRNVPEPTTMFLLGLGLVGLAGVRRKL